MFLHTCKYFNLKTPFFNVILAFHDEIVCAHNIFLPSFHTYFTFQTAVQSHVLRATLPQAFSCLIFSNRNPALCQAQRHDNMPAAPGSPIHDIPQTIYHQPYDKQRLEHTSTDGRNATHSPN